PDNPSLNIRKPDLYFQLRRYEMALTSYEQAFTQVTEEQRVKYLSGYGAMLTIIVKDLNKQFRYDESMTYIPRWLQHDLVKRTALKYAVSLARHRKYHQEMKMYAQKGYHARPDGLYSNLRLMDIDTLNAEKYAPVYNGLQKGLLENPYPQ